MIAVLVWEFDSRPKIASPSNHPLRLECDQQADENWIGQILSCRPATERF